MDKFNTEALIERKFSEAKEYATTKANLARLEAIGVISGLAIILGILGYFGLELIVKSKIEEIGAKNLIEEIRINSQKVSEFLVSAKKDTDKIQKLLSRYRKNGIVQPHNKDILWNDIKEKTDIFDVDIGLSDTQAKFALISIFSYHDGKEKDHVVHVFGKDLPQKEPWYAEGLTEQDSGYVAVVHNGQQAGSDFYGMHSNFLAPLNENKTIDIRLASGYTSGKHNILFRVIGYVE